VDKAYLEDLAPGQVFTSEARAVVDARSIKRFAGEFDPQPFHLDEATARPTFFKKLVASGWHTTAVTMQLLVQTRMTTLNQNDQPVQTMIANLLAFRRREPAA